MSHEHYLFCDGVCKDCPIGWRIHSLFDFEDNRFRTRYVREHCMYHMEAKIMKKYYNRK